jgi:polyferredoxin
MNQIGRPRGLIDYVTFEDAEKEQAGKPTTPVFKTLFRPRTLAYFMLWGGIGLGLLFALGSRTRLDISAQHDRNPLFVRMSDGAVRNAYTVKLRNMESRPRTVRVTMEGVPQAAMWVGDTGSREAAGRSFETKLDPDAVTKLRVFVVSPAGDGSRQEFSLSVQANDDPYPSDRHELVLERGE